VSHGSVLNENYAPTRVTSGWKSTVEGVYDLKKVASQAWAAGDRIYWDNTARQTTKTLTANTLIGVATEAVAGGATDLIGRVRLNGAF
jgi:predicted RecA/RadA family phage recombinase